MEYTLSQVVGVIKNTFDEFFWEFQFWCTAEILSCKTVGKNTYIELGEYDEDNQVIAKMRGNIFKPWLIENFFRETKLDGKSMVRQKILFQGRVTYHKDYGMSILINLISSTYTLWLAQQTQNTILQTLQKEWVLGKNKLTFLPEKPLSIAVISGETSAWLQDFLQILDDAKISYEYTLFPATVQWNSAKEAVLAQLVSISSKIAWESIENASLFDQIVWFDAVCIVRGGWESGGIVRQNDVDIARTICHLPVPVIVAIGHTQDISVLEAIAWKFAKTPSEAAFHILQHYRNIIEEVVWLYDSISVLTHRKTEQYIRTIQQLFGQINEVVPRIVATYKERIESLYTNIYAYHPVGLLAKWYAIVRDSEWDIIWKNPVIEGDRLNIETAGYTITATVDSVATK